MPAQSQSLTVPAEVVPLSLEDMPETAPASPLALVVEQQVDVQTARVEPTPVAMRAPLPPGTVATQLSSGDSRDVRNENSESLCANCGQSTDYDSVQVSAFEDHYTVYLPLIAGQSTHTIENLALHPDIWMEATRDWLIETIATGLEGESDVIIRYPTTWEKSTRDEGMQLISGDNQILVTFESDDQKMSASESRPHLDIIEYQRAGYLVTEAVVKGLPAWRILPSASVGDFCEKVIVALPSGWMHFQYGGSGALEARCSEYDAFMLVLSSLQMRVGAQTADVDSESDRSGITDSQIQAINYNRQAAYDYAAQYWSSCNNSDGYCAPNGEGMHFTSHALCAAGFPIHWCANPQQNHSNPIIVSASTQRNYLMGLWDMVSSTAAGNLRVGDVVFIGKGSCWGFNGVVTSMQGGIPYITTHSANHWNTSYDSFYSICGTPAEYSFLHIDSVDDYARPQLNSGLSFNPSSPVLVEQGVAAVFNVHNYGGQGITLRLRVTTNGAGEFSETGDIYLASGGDFTYNQSRSFTTIGDFNTCAQMNTGSGWQNVPQTGGGVSCRNLSIISRNSTDLRLNSNLDVVPSQLEVGGSVRATFSVVNTAIGPITENLRARVVGGNNFAESGSQSFAPGQSVTYDKTRVFGSAGIYEIVADHYFNGSWTALWGAGTWAGSRFVRVMAPPPPLPAQNKGQSPTSGHAGEPVNTSTGNYFYDFTDMSDPTPGLPMAVTRWYNALDADYQWGRFGHGIVWRYGMSVNWRSDKTAEVIMEDGHSAYFVGQINPANPKDMSGVYKAQGKEFGVLERYSDGTAVLTQPDQTRYHFDNGGQITRISNPYPAEINIVRSGDMVLQLVHSAGITYTINYTTVEWFDPFDPFFPFPFPITNDYIASIQSSTGKAVTYTYAVGEWAEANLTQVTRSDGSAYTYEYDESHRLTAAYTPNGHAFVRNIYDGQGRVIRQYDQSGQESVFTYGAQITAPRVYTDALGNTLTHIYDSNYYLIREVDALGYTTVYTRDAAGNVLVRRDKDGSIWRYTYDARGNRLTETDPLNHTWNYAYDARNNLTSQTDPTGRSWSYEYDAQNRLVRTMDPLGHHREYEYDAKGNLISERDEVGAETRYAANDLGLRTVITDALGYVTRMAYNALGNQTVYTDANGNVALFFYDMLNRLERSIDPAGTIITFTYDAMGNLLTESNGLGQFRHYTYDAHDRIVAETDFNGNVTRYGYDALGHRTVMTDALGFTAVYTYNAVGKLIAQRGRDDAVTRYEYDRVGRLVREIDSLGRVTEYAYDAAGRQTEVRRPCAVCGGGVAVSRTVYDAAGRIIEERDPRGAVTRYTHDAVGRAAIMTDAYGYTRTTTYDSAGRVIQETDPLRAITRYEYDLLGQVITTTNALGYQSINTYDAVGRVIQTTNERGYTTTFVYDANDRVVAIYDALGNFTRNTYDGAGRLIAVTDALSRTTTYTYDANGNRLTETNPRGHTTTVIYDALNRVVEVIEPAGCCGVGSRFSTYDAAGRVTQETDALGYTRVITYDVAGRRSAERSPLGYTTVYTYDVADNLAARREPTGAVWRFEVDANGNQIQQIDPLGYTHRTEYDLLNRAVREIDPLGAVTTRQYDGAGRVASQRDPRGATTRYTYDLLGRITQETDPLGYTRIITYDGAGNRNAEQDARGFVTTYVYDALNREIAQTDPLGHSRYTLYDAVGQTLAVVDYKGYATRYEYDTAGNAIRVTDALSHTISTEYDALNRPVAVTDALSQTTHTGYDVLGRVVSHTTALGYTIIYTYNAEGWQTARRDALGGVWWTDYDAVGRPVRETDPLDREKVVAYDALGRAVAQTDALGRVTMLTYDPAGRLTAVTGPDGTAQHYTYDAVGNILAEQDGNGHVTRYEYDLNGSLIRKTDALGRKWHYRYDAAGNLLETLSPSGHQVLQEYDPLNRLTATHHDDAQVLALAYDANGNRAVMTDTLGVTLYVYDPLNRLIGSGDELGSRVVLESYDAVGQRISLTYPDGTLATYAYDADGDLTSVTTPDGQVTIYLYDALGRPVHVTQGNGVVVETDYDAVGNTLSITQYDAGGQVFLQHDYSVDAADRRTRAIEQRLAEILTIDYTYDALDRLIASIADDGRETHYAFDDAGNRMAMWGARLVGGVTEIYTVTYTYNAANQLLCAVDNVRGLTTYTYDADGNRSAERAPERWSEYAYDAGGRMIEARVHLGQFSNLAYKDGVYQQYTYDGLGRRARVATLLASDNSLVTQRDYRYNDGAGGWDVLQTYDETGESFGTYLFDHSLHRLAYWQDDAAGYLQNDSLGSVLGATGVEGAAPATLMRYGDYGEELGPEEALPTEDGYTGYERDAYTGLNYARHRYYDARTGMFLTVDPYPLNHYNLLDLHRYLYVQSDPINWLDQLGLAETGVEEAKALADYVKSRKSSFEALRRREGELKVLGGEYTLSERRIYLGLLNDFLEQDRLLAQRIQKELSNSWSRILLFFYKGQKTQLQNTLNEISLRTEQMRKSKQDVEKQIHDLEELEEVQNDIRSSEQDFSKMRQAVTDKINDSAKVTTANKGYCTSFVNQVYRPVYDAYFGEGAWGSHASASVLYTSEKITDRTVWSREKSGQTSWQDVLQPGDLLFITKEDSRSTAGRKYGHVFIYAGNGVFYDTAKEKKSTDYEEEKISLVARPLPLSWDEALNQ